MFYLIILLTKILFSEAEFNLRQQFVGTNCGASNVYIIEGMEVTPWPPYSEAVGQLQIYGGFEQTTYVQELVLGTCINNMFWNYNPIDIYQSYPIGMMVFTVPFVFPKGSGSYTTNFQITAGDHICCWQFSYSY